MAQPPLNSYVASGDAGSSRSSSIRGSHKPSFHHVKSGCHIRCLAGEHTVVRSDQVAHEDSVIMPTSRMTRWSKLLNSGDIDEVRAVVAQPLLKAPRNVAPQR
jgi:hypothetical protein